MQSQSRWNVNQISTFRVFPTLHIICWLRKILLLTDGLRRLQSSAWVLKITHFRSWDNNKFFPFFYASTCRPIELLLPLWRHAYRELLSVDEHSDNARFSLEVYVVAIPCPTSNKWKHPISQADSLKGRLHILTYKASFYDVLVRSTTNL